MALIVGLAEGDLAGEYGLAGERDQSRKICLTDQEDSQGEIPRISSPFGRHSNCDLNSRRRYRGLIIKNYIRMSWNLGQKIAEKD